MAVTKQTKTILGSTSSSFWTWKQVITEIWEDNYITTNKSTIKVQSYIGTANSAGQFGGTASINITCNGDSRTTSKTWIYQSFTVPAKGWLLVQEETFEVEHEEDGTKEIDVSSSLSTTNFNPNSCSASGSMVLTTIPRASSISVSNYDLGQNPNIVIGRKVDSFTSTLSYRIGNRTGILVEKYNDKNYVWGMSEELINQIKLDNPKNKLVDAIVYCDTYDGDTQIGSQTSTTFKLTITDKPVITDVVRAELNSSISSLTDKVLRSISQNQFTIAATASAGTTIASYKVINGTQNSGNVASNIVNLNDIQTFYDSDGELKTKFIITCIDARGNTSEEYPLELDFIDYVDVSISKTDVKITRTTNTTNDALLHMTGNFYNELIGNTQNNLIIQYKFKKQGTTDYSELKTISAIYENNTFKIENLLLENEINYQENYEFVFYVIDSVNNGDTYTYIYASSIPTEIHHKKGAYIRELDTDVIKVKGQDISASDTLPIGAIVEYDGNIVPEGYEEYENVLYNNEQGTTGNITLKDSAENYKYLEIYIATEDLKTHSYQKVYSPNGKTICLYVNNTSVAGYFTNYGDNITINGTSITRNRGAQYNIIVGNMVSDYGHSNPSQISITRVIGYK